MKIYGQLEQAGLEVVSNLPTEAFEGREVLLDDGNIYTYFDGEWKLTGSLTQAVKTQPSVDPLEDAGDILGLDTDGKINSGFIRDTDKLPDQSGATPGQVLTTDGTIATWEDATGTGGGLEVEYRNADFTAVFGKHYLVDTSSNVVNVTLPSIASVPVEEQGNAKIRFSDEGRSWHVNPANLIPDPLDKIYDADVGETYQLNVMMTWVQIQRAADLIWNLDHVFQPLEAGSGGGGGASAGINYLIDGGNAEQGVLDVEVVGDGTIEGETVAPLIGTSSYKATVNSSVTTQPKFRLAVNDIDLAFLDSTKLKGTGLFVTDAEGWKVRLIDASDDSLIPGTEVILPNGRFTASFGNVPETGKSYKYELYAETAPADSVCTYDSLFYGFKETGAADLNGWKKYYHGTDFTITSSDNFVVVFGMCQPFQDPIKGTWSMYFQINKDRGSEVDVGSTDTTISGITFANIAGQLGQAVSGNAAGVGSSNIRTPLNALALTGTGLIRDQNSSSATRYLTYLGVVELEGKPTWADYEPTGVALNNETLNANNRAFLTWSSNQTIPNGAWTFLRPNVVDEINGFTYDSGTGVFTVLADTFEGRVSYGGEFSQSGFSSVSVRLRNGADNLNFSPVNTGQSNLSYDLKLSKGDSFGCQIILSGAADATFLANEAANISIESKSTFTSETTVVADLATKDTAGFVYDDFLEVQSLEDADNTGGYTKVPSNVYNIYSLLNVGVFLDWRSFNTELQAGQRYRLEWGFIFSLIGGTSIQRMRLLFSDDTTDEEFVSVGSGAAISVPGEFPIANPLEFIAPISGTFKLQYWGTTNGNNIIYAQTDPVARLYIVRD